MWIVLGVVFLSFLGLVLLLLPRFTPRAPRWAEGLVPPRYRRRATLGSMPAAASEAGEEPAPEACRTPAVAGVPGVNGATAIGARAHLDRRKAESSR